MLYYTGEVFHRLANQNRGHIHVMLECKMYKLQTDEMAVEPLVTAPVNLNYIIQVKKGILK